MTVLTKTQIKAEITASTANGLLGGTILDNIVDSYTDVTLSPGVSVLTYGADPTGVRDSTAAFNLATATGQNVDIPAGIYTVTDAINLTFSGQIVYGAGRANSIISVPKNFNQAALGVFVASGNAINGNAAGNGVGSGPDLRDFKITFAQPDTNVRANLNPYPPALYFQNAFRFKLTRMRITQAQTGIDMRGDSGGAVINDLEISCYTKHIWIDGSSDTVRLNAVQIWPFEMTTNQFFGSTSPFQDPANIGLNVGRCDGMNLSNFLNICGTGINAFAGAGGFGALIWGTNCGFDTNNGIVTTGVTSNANMSFSSSYFNSGYSNRFGVQWASGQLVLNGCEIIVGGNGSASPYMQQTGGYIAVNGGQAFCGSADITVFQQSAGFLSITGMQFNKLSNIAYANPAIHIQGGRAIIQGNQLNDKGTGAGTFITIDADDYHTVLGNTAIGYTLSLPVPGIGVYFPNLTGTGNTLNGSLNLNFNGGAGLGTILTLNGRSSADTSQGAQIKLVNTSTGAVGAPANQKYWRIGSAGDLQLLNGAYNTFLLILPDAGGVQGNPSLAIPAGGSAGQGFMYTATANFGTFFGSGAPTLSAGQGSLYLRSDGNSSNNRAYINVNGTTGWTSILTSS